MDAAVAREIAIAAHHQSRDRHGGLVIEHVARVAAAVPPEAKPTAWLHDVLEKTPTTLDDLREQGLGAFEGEALALLTRADGESYELHVLRIAHARRPAGRLARTIKLADLDDHAESHEWALGDPPYRWAQHHVNDSIARIDTEPWPVVVLAVPAASVDTSRGAGLRPPSRGLPTHHPDEMNSISMQGPEILRGAPNSSR